MRFVHQAVIGSYGHHPGHVAFAADRVSIDYQQIEPDVDSGFESRDANRHHKAYLEAVESV